MCALPPGPSLLTTTDRRTLAEFEHPAFMYSDTDSLVDYLVPYIHSGLDEHAFVFVALKSEHIGALRSVLGDDARRTAVVDTAKWHPHPNTRLNALHQIAADAAGNGSSCLRLAVEPVWPQRRELVSEWQRFESALNHVLAPYHGSLVCLYDASDLDPSIVDVAESTHPHVHRAGERSASTHFESPDAFLRRWHDDAAIPASEPRHVQSIEELASIRAELTGVATDLRLPLRKTHDLCLAANEILTNALIYGSGPVEMWTYIEDGFLVVEVRDRGNGIADPLVGYRPPPTFKVGGRGVWLARQVVDLLEIIPTEHGTIAKLYLRA